MDRTKEVPEGLEDLTELDRNSLGIAAAITNAPEGVEQAISSAVRTLDPSSFEPIVRKTSDEIYALIMEGCQDYLRDNAEFNIGSHIDMLERERKFEREKVEALTAEIADLRAQLDEAMEALDKCRCIIKFHVKNAGVCCTKGGEVFSALDAHNAAVEALAKHGGGK